MHIEFFLLNSTLSNISNLEFSVKEAKCIEIKI